MNRFKNFDVFLSLNLLRVLLGVPFCVLVSIRRDAPVCVDFFLFVGNMLQNLNLYPGFGNVFFLLDNAISQDFTVLRMNPVGGGMYSMYVCMRYEMHNAQRTTD